MKRFTLQVLHNGIPKLTVPQCEVHEKGYVISFVNGSRGNVFVSKFACEKAGLDGKEIQAQAMKSIVGIEHLLLRMGVNEGGTELVDWEVREAAQSKIRAAQYAEEKRAKYAAQIEEARATGKDVVLSKWTETRRAKEGGQWGEYLFLCCEYVTPAGEFKTSAVNSY